MLSVAIWSFNKKEWGLEKSTVSRGLRKDMGLNLLVKDLCFDQDPFIHAVETVFF